MRENCEGENQGCAGKWEDQFGRPDTERYLVSALLACPAATVWACQRLRGRHFADAALGAIWDGLSGHEDPDGVDAIAVMRAAYTRHIAREPAHFAVWAKDLIDANPAPMTARYHIARLRRLSAQDRAKRAVEAAISAIQDGAPPAVVRGAFNSAFAWNT